MDAKMRWVELEGVFDVNFNRGDSPLTFRLRGKKDGVYRDKNGQFWLFETKTKGRMNEDELMKTLDYDFQNLFYITAASKVLAKPIIGVQYNVIHRPDYRKSTVETRRELEKDVMKRPEFYYRRFEVPYSKQRQALFREELHRKLTEFHGWLNHKLPTYKNESACTGKGSCSFISACADVSGRMAGYTQTRRLFNELDE
jgi:hypothetical protein